MRREIPAVRILPMSDKTQGFRGRSIEQVQREVFLRWLPAHRGRWRYPRAGLNAEPGTIVLFQFQARIIATAVFLRDEKFERPRLGYAGEMYFDPQSFRTFDPLDVADMRWDVIDHFDLQPGRLFHKAQANESLLPEGNVDAPFIAFGECGDEALRPEPEVLLVIDEEIEVVRKPVPQITT